MYEQANFNGNSPFGNAAKGKYLGRPTRVGSYPAANKLGLCDMHGNVWQWTQWTANMEDSVRMSRGGGWPNYGYGCVAAYLRRDAPTDRHDYRGFRLAGVPVR